MIDTNDNVHYLTAKFLAKLLKPLTINEFCLDYFFDVACKINDIPE